MPSESMPPGTRGRLKDCDRIAEPGQIVSAGHARRSRADHGDRLVALRQLLQAGAWPRPQSCVSVAMRFRARIEIGSSISPRRQACSHGWRRPARK